VRLCNAALGALVLAGTLGIAVCSSESQTTEGVQPTTTPATETVADASAATTTTTDAAAAAVAPSPLSPQFGGVVQSLGDYVVEVLSRQDGHLEAQVRDQQGQPVSTDAISVAADVEKDDGERMQVVMLPSVDRYIGTVAGVQGRRPVHIALNRPDTVEAVAQAVYNELDLAPVQVSLEPQHHGKVVVVGDTRMELSASQNGKIHVSVTDFQGTPIPPESVTLNQIQLESPSGPVTVTLQPEGAMFVGRASSVPSETFSAVFDLGFGSVLYQRVRLARLESYAPTVTFKVPERFTKREGWRQDFQWVKIMPTTPRGHAIPAPPPPSVVVKTGAPPPPPTIVVKTGAPPPPPTIVVKTGTPPPPPRVKVVAPPPPPPPRPPSVKVVVPPPPPPPRPPSVKVTVPRPPAPPRPPSVKVTVH
jgi:hypothetical protein